MEPGAFIETMRVGAALVGCQLDTRATPALGGVDCPFKQGRAKALSANRPRHPHRLDLRTPRAMTRQAGQERQKQRRNNLGVYFTDYEPMVWVRFNGVKSGFIGVVRVRPVFCLAEIVIAIERDQGGNVAFSGGSDGQGTACHSESFGEYAAMRNMNSVKCLPAPVARLRLEGLQPLRVLACGHSRSRCLNFVRWRGVSVRKRDLRSLNSIGSCSKDGAPLSLHRAARGAGQMPLRNTG